MIEYTEIFFGLAAVIVAFYYYLTSNFDFWKERGVPGPKPIPLFGNLKNVLMSKISLGDFYKKLYDEYKNEPAVGVFERSKPVLLVRDPELVKAVLIRDFSKFVDRGLRIHEKTEPLSLHLFNLKHSSWRPLRAKLSPVFTTGKLKEMFVLIQECAEVLEKHLEKLAARGEIVECREMTAKYTTDVIGSCAFGIEMNAISDEESEFRRMGRKIFMPDFTRRMKDRVRNFLPRLYDLLGYFLPQSEFSRFFTDVIVGTMDHRKTNGIVRKDFINLLLEVQNNVDKVGDMKVTDKLLTAQAFVFFVAGFETSSTTMSNALYELALNHDIQDKLRKEIKEEYSKNGGELKYETIKDMVYLDQVFRETLRKYPPGTILLRECTSDYTFEGTKISIPKGTSIRISVYALQKDPSIYPNPDVFDPERFSEEVTATRHPMAYIPFGDGPRNCIGARFAAYQVKVGLIHILKSFKVDVCEKTQIPYVLDPNSVLLAPKGGIHLKFIKAES